MDREEKWLLEEKYGGVKSEAFHADLKRLASGEPLAYLIGHAPFLGCRIYLDSHPLIPRPESEYWVEKAIEAIKEKMGGSAAHPLRILDLCAGSGCIGVAVAKALPGAQVDFAELDERHHATIQKNLEANDIVTDRTHIFGGNLFANITDTYDFILTNPPYIDPALDRAEASVKTHEPHLALYGGHEGVEIIVALIAAAQNHLNPSGQLWVEHEPEQSEQITELAKSVGLARATTHPDQYDVKRFSIIEK